MRSTQHGRVLLAKLAEAMQPSSTLASAQWHGSTRFACALSQPCAHASTVPTLGCSQNGALPSIPSGDSAGCSRRQQYPAGLEPGAHVPLAYVGSRSDTASSTAAGRPTAHPFQSTRPSSTVPATWPAEPRGIRRGHLSPRSAAPAPALHVTHRTLSTSGAAPTSDAATTSPPPNAAASASATTASTSAFAASATAAAAVGASVDRREAAKFAALAASWWRSTDGPFAPLHALNPARVRFMRQSLAAVMGLDADAPEPLAGLRVLDVGCGGGILSESLARLGACVHGIDVTRENVEAARLHAAKDPLVAQRVRYDVISAEDLAASGTASYDVVIASEVIEHVSKPHQLLAVLASLLTPPPAAAPAAAVTAELQPAGGDGNPDADGGDGGAYVVGGAEGFSGGGALIVSTLNRTPAAWAVAVAGAEYVARIVPPGTHTWKKFITPEELAIMADACGLQVWHAAGMAPSGPRMSWDLTSDLSINYITTLTPRRRIPQ